MCIYCKKKHCPVGRCWVQQFTTPGHHHKSSCASPRWCDRPPCRWWSGPMPRWKHTRSNREACSTPGWDAVVQMPRSQRQASKRRGCHVWHVTHWHADVDSEKVWVLGGTTINMYIYIYIIYIYIMYILLYYLYKYIYLYLDLPSV